MEHRTAADEEALGKVAFGNLLKSRGIAQKRGAQGKRTWLGIRLVVMLGDNVSGSPIENPSRENEPGRSPLAATGLSQHDLFDGADDDDDLPATDALGQAWDL